MMTMNWILGACLFILLSINASGYVFKHSLKDLLNDLKRKNGNTEFIAPQLKDLIIGRCEEYQFVNHPEFFKDKKVNCHDVYDEFVVAFETADKMDSCPLPREIYEPLIDKLSHPVPRDKGVFWTKTKHFVFEYAEEGKYFFTLESTFPGFMFDGLNWCDSKLAHVDLPNGCSCRSSEVVYGFWKEASLKYAQSVSGEVTVMLNGSLPQIFKMKSAFAREELPNMNPDKVTKITAVVIHSLDDMNEEIKPKCGKDESLQKLEKLVKEKGIPFNCVEDPKNTVFLQCARNPNHPRCQNL